MNAREHFDADRRRCLGVAAACAGMTLGLQRAAAHVPFGPVDPALAAPDVRLTDHERRLRGLPELLRGKVSAVQMIFTGCSATCPLQGVLFSAVQAAMSRARMEGRQLISLSIDPLGDTPQALQAWRMRFGAGTQWVAAVPAAVDLDRLQRTLTNAPADGLDGHSTQVFFFDAQARLQWRSGELPSAGEVAEVLGKLT